MQGRAMHSLHSMQSCSQELAQTPAFTNRHVRICSSRPVRHSGKQTVQRSGGRDMLRVYAAAETQQKDEQASTSEPSGKKEDEFYEVYINKPLGIRFGRGSDGGAYVTSVDASKGNIDDQVQAGDKIHELSASFGEDVWSAGNFGQCMYAIKTRNGELYFKFKKNYGDLSCFDAEESSDTEKRFKKERGGGNYGEGTKELQIINFKKKKEREAKRESLFESGLDKFNAKDIEGALFDFEEVIAMEIRQPVKAKDFIKTSSMFRVAHYNVACCYSALEQIAATRATSMLQTDAGLESLDVAMKSGFDQFNKIRNDPNLEKLRQSQKFKTLMDQYDEPVIDTNLFKGFGGLFGKK